VRFDRLVIIPTAATAAPTVDRGKIKVRKECHLEALTGPHSLVHLL
jgi:hypothetical protein